MHVVFNYVPGLKKLLVRVTRIDILVDELLVQSYVKHGFHGNLRRANNGNVKELVLPLLESFEVHDCETSSFL